MFTPSPHNDITRRTSDCKIIKVDNKIYIIPPEENRSGGSNQNENIFGGGIRLFHLLWLTLTFSSASAPYFCCRLMISNSFFSSSRDSSSRRGMSRSSRMACSCEGSEDVANDITVRTAAKSAKWLGTTYGFNDSIWKSTEKRHFDEFHNNEWILVRSRTLLSGSIIISSDASIRAMWPIK